MAKMYSPRPEQYWVLVVNNPNVNDNSTVLAATKQP